MTESVCVVVLSYNRPRMLREALASVRGADHVVVLDDGSSFDVEKAVRESDLACPHVAVRLAPPMTVAERLRTPRVGAAINEAIRDTGCGLIAYLCDDDLFHDGWLPAAKGFFESAPAETHFASGEWRSFDDGEPPGGRACPLGAHGLTTGNFVHRRSCSVGHGVWWSEESVAVHDSRFVFGAVLKAHPAGEISRLPVVAGWRREHAANLLKFTDDRGYTAAAVALLGRERLE